MSRIAEIILITSAVDEGNVQALSFWMGSPDALDLRRERRGSDERADVGAAPGKLLPLAGRVSEERRIVGERLSGCVWAAVTNHLHWGRFMEKVRTTDWEMPERVQLLVKDDGDSYFRLYMLIHGELRNVVPAPADGGYDRDWDYPCRQRLSVVNRR